MIRRIRRIVWSRRGFTLIELLIVVAIIGVLAAIAIPNLIGAQRSSKNARASADTAQIVSQTQLYHNDFNATTGAATYAPLWDNTAGRIFMAKTTDPWNSTAGSAYVYANLGLTGEVKAWSVGLNAMDDTYTSDDVGFSNSTGAR